MPKVRMPDGVVVAFPDDMPPEKIRSLIASKFPAAAPSAKVTNPAPTDQPPAGAVPGSRAYGDWAASRARAGMNVPQVSMTPPAAPLPPPGPMDFLTQGMSGLNEGIAQGLGAPVDLATLGLNMASRGINAVAHTDLPQIEHPFLGGETFRGILSPTIKADSDNPALQMTRRVAQEVGAWAVPGGGMAARTAKPLAKLAEEIGPVLASGGGAAVAQQLAPGNPIAEIVGQVAGAMTPAGVMKVLKGRPPTVVPSIDDLRATKNAAYKAADQSGVTYSPSDYDNMLSGAVADAVNDHISQTRHDKAYSFLIDMINRRGQPMTLTELDQLRQEVRRDLITPSISNPDRAADAHFGQIFLDNIDQMIANDARGGAAITAAREANTRLKKAETLADALTVAKRNAAASGSGGNLNNAIRQQIKNILNSPKRSRGFTPDELDQMENLVKQGNVENLLRWVGKFAPGGNGLIGALEVVGTLHNPALAAMPVAGMVAKGIADRGTVSRLEKLQAQVAMGKTGPKVTPLPKMSPAVLYAQGANQMDRRPVQITVRGGSVH